LIASKQSSTCGYCFPSGICWRCRLFSIVCFGLFCQRSVGHRCVGLCLQFPSPLLTLSPVVIGGGHLWYLNNVAPNIDSLSQSLRIPSYTFFFCWPYFVIIQLRFSVWDMC
jgi:hypothetical protein